MYSVHERHCFHSVAECMNQMFKYLHIVCLQDNPRLYLQLIDMGLQQNPLNEDNIISIIDQFLSRDTDPEQKVLFAQRKVEFLEDFGNDILRYVIVFLLLSTLLVKITCDLCIHTSQRIIGISVLGKFV